MAFDVFVSRNVAAKYAFKQCWITCVLGRLLKILRLNRGAVNRSSATGGINSSIVSDRNVSRRQHLQGLPTVQPSSERNQRRSALCWSTDRLVLPGKRQVGNRAADLLDLPCTGRLFALCVG